MLENPKAATLSFTVPPHGHNFQYTTVFLKQGKESSRLCRYPPCEVCLASPKASILHVDCFNLAKSKFVKFIPTPSSITKLALSHPPQPLWSIPDLAAHSNWIDVLNIIKRFEKMAPELRQMVINHSRESTLWRYCTILTWDPPID